MQQAIRRFQTVTQRIDRSLLSPAQTTVRLTANATRRQVRRPETPGSYFLVLFVEYRPCCLGDSHVAECEGRSLRFAFIADDIKGAWPCD